MTSVFEIFKIGIGPSSSHTVGPMRASYLFAKQLEGLLGSITKIQCELFGSLGATGKGHSTDKAVILGLLGHQPESIDSNKIEEWLSEIAQTQKISILQNHTVEFIAKRDILFIRRSLPQHANAMTLKAFNQNDEVVLEKTYFSIGGGFIVDENSHNKETATCTTLSPYPFKSFVQLSDYCDETKYSIAEIIIANEKPYQTEIEIKEKLLFIYKVMADCIELGYKKEGTLPGGLHIKKRAAKLYNKLINSPSTNSLQTLEWVNLFALAVNEENACGGKVVTAPTNGAAGIIPAVLRYYLDFGEPSKPNDEIIIEFLLTAGAIAMLYKENASISGAEVGCQGEVGVACSMAAGALTAVMGGSIAQIGNAAEIGMEHNLGLTCDPIGGLVQIPCIERNAVAAVQAINAAQLALNGDGNHYVSLDKVITTMKKTGEDMRSKYKETSRGGLAINIVEC